MKSNVIIPVIAFFCLLVLIIVLFIVYRTKRKKNLKKEIEELDIEKNKIIDIPLLTELSKVKELVKTDDLKKKLSDWDNTINEIKEDKIDAITDLITEADFFIEKKEYNNAIKKIADIEIMLNLLKSKTDNLLEEIKIITNSEERNRAIITKLKVIFRELESKYERTEKDYEPVKESIELKFVKIEKTFKKFETLMDKNDYVSVEKLVVSLEDELNKFKKFLEDAPDILLMETVLIPNKIEEAKTLYFRMQRDGYPLDYLNIEYNIKEIQNKLTNIMDDLKEFKLGDSEIELKTMLDYFNTIYASFDKERESKDIFKEDIKKLKKKIENVNRIVYDVYIQMDDIKSNYDLTDEEMAKFSHINHDLEKINEDYKTLYEHGKGKTFAYSKLSEELLGLNNRLNRLQDDLDYRLKSITSMKDDESRAKEQLQMIESLLLQSKNKLKDYKIPEIPNNYFIELREAGEAIREIIKELDKKPIVIKVLNIRVDTARDLVFKIYNKTNDLVKNVILCENLIVYGNRFKSSNEEIEKAIDEASKLFYKGSYNQAINILIKTIGKEDINVIDRFELDKEN